VPQRRIQVRRRFFKGNLDYLIAFVVLCISSVFFVRAYIHLFQQRLQEQKILTDIMLGDSNYKILFRDNCVGYIKLSASEDKLFRIRFNMKLDLLIQGQLEPVTANLESYFNPLGQQVGSQFIFDFHGDQMVLTTFDLNPIRILLKGSLVGNVVDQEFSFPGPIMLEVREEEGVFDIAYPFIDLETFSFRLPTVEQLKLALPFEVKYIGTEKVCDESEIQPLDLESVAYLRPLNAFLGNRFGAKND